MSKEKETKLKVLVARKEKLFQRVQNAYDLLKTLKEDDRKISEFIIRGDRIEDDYEAYENVLEEILNLKLQVTPDVEPEPIYTQFKAYEDLFYTIMAAVKKFKARCESKKEDSTPQVQIRLPKLELPKFDGKLSDWQSFYDQFKVSIHDNSSLATIAKFHYLLSALAGPPLSIVRSLPITEANYPIVWESLVEKYEDRRLLANNLLDVIFEFRHSTLETITGLSNFLETFYESVMSLRSMSIPDLADFMLLYISLRTLPVNTRKAFETLHVEESIPTFDQLIKFLRERLKVLQISVSTEQKSYSNVMSRPRSKTTSAFAASVTTSQRISNSLLCNSLCPYCKQSHSIYRCPEFLSLSPPERNNIIRTNGLCFNCLKSNHASSTCPSKTSCFKCNYRHHTLLCPTSSSVTTAEVYPISQDSKASCAASVLKMSTVLLGTALIHVKNSVGEFQEVRALIDSAAMTSFITVACAQRLGLTFNKCHIPISGLGHNFIGDCTGITTCVMKPRDSKYPQFPVEAVILPRITSNMPTVTLPLHLCHQFKELKLADPKYHVSSPIEFLIGADIFPEIYDGQRFVGQHGSPSALHSIFGWVITGKVQSTIPNANISSLVSTLSLDRTLRQFWEIEEVPRAIPKNPDDVLCEAIFVKHCTRNEEGRYIVPLPFQQPQIPLGETYSLALSRFHSLERRLARHPQVKGAYINFMRQYESLGHMSEVSHAIHSSTQYYIPHHCIFKNPLDVNAKFRTVFDASMKSSSGYSLNDILLKGPKLQCDISTVLLKFRLHKFVFTADICKMYRQILIRIGDRSFQHILWREEPSAPIKEYELNTVTYGVTTAPYLAMRALHQLVCDEGDKHPAASRVLLEDIYVDDVLTGADSEQEACDLQSQLIALLKLAGLELRKWTSNSSKVLNQVPSEHQEVPVSFQASDDYTFHILGIQWSPVNDYFSYEVKHRRDTATKRSILSIIARIFDPLGWICPVVFLAKYFMQRLWILGLGWDDPLPEDISNEWSNFAVHLNRLQEIRIARHVLSDSYRQCQLIGFADASERGFGAVIYFRITDDHRHWKSHLLIAKSRVAPLKTISIPRLELCGAVLLSRLIKWTCSALPKHLNLEKYAFSDSLTVLSWLRTPPHRLKTYEANRVSEILDNLAPSSWRYVSTHENPADVASRGILPHQFLNQSLWWTGPAWITQPVEEWPFTAVPSRQEFELMNTTLIAQTKTDSSEMLDRFSSFLKMSRCIAWCFRFIYNARTTHKDRLSGPLSVQEQDKSLLTCIKLVQNDHFYQDIRSVTNGQICTAKLRTLYPFLDAGGILRVGGRLHNSTRSYDAQHPILIPKQSHLTKIMIDYYHRSYLHAGPRALQSLLQRKYWILSARSAIRSQLRRCTTCFRQKAPLMQPLMGTLPVSRVSQGRPFINVGVDFGGPFSMKESKRRNPKIFKAYLCLFVCLATKAVHLEVVSELTTDGFLAAFDRFVSRRGLCSNVYSDCGTNFVGAARYLTGIAKLFQNSVDEDTISNTLSKNGIHWNFNPPSAPHFGGLWEAGIRSTKYHLKRVIGNQVLTFEEFATIFAKIEAILNSRPLCALSSDPNEMEALTPGHFLVGGPLVAIPEQNILDIQHNRLNRWELIRKVTQHFWQKWHLDYLHTLQQRAPTWSTMQPNVEVGTLVLLKESNSPPSLWPLGRITKIYPGEDGIVRVAAVKTTRGNFVRPVVKLSPLPNQ